MWLFDISHDIYSREMNRRISIIKRSKSESHGKQCFLGRYWDTNVYTVVEEWHTPESQGDTGDWDYYTFMTYQDAAVFIAELAYRLNTPMQRRLAQAAEKFVTEITQGHKKAVKQASAGLKNQESSRRKAECEQQKSQREQQKKQEAKRRAQEAEAKRRAQEAEAKRRAQEAEREQKAIQRELQKIERKKAEREQQQDERNKKAVYIFDMSNNTVKIGVSNNVEQRVKSIEQSSGLTIVRRCCTDKMPVKLALEIESNCHSHFAEQQTKGEFFEISYEDARAYLSTFAPITYEREN